MADNTFLTRLVVEMVGMDAAIQKMKDMGASQKEITKYVKEYNDAQKRASTEDLAAIQKVNAELNKSTVNLKQRATALHEVEQAAKAAGNVVKPTSFGQMLGRDVNTSQFAKYQSEVASLSAKMKGVTDPAGIQAYETHLSAIAQKYGQINVEAAKLAGISRETFVKGISAEQYVAVSNAVQKLREQTTPAVTAVEKLTDAQKRFEQIVQQTMSPVEKLKQQLRDLQSFKSTLPDDFKATDQQAQALHRRFVELNAQLKELNKPVDTKAPFLALMRQYDPQAAVQQRDARSAQIMAGVGAGAYDLATAERMNKALMEQTKHFQEVSTKGKVNTNQMLQYTAAVRNTAESLASGMSPATVAMTQGMQVLGAYMGENIKIMAGLGVAALALVVPVMTLIRAMDVADRTRKMESDLRILGRTAETSARSMMVLSQSMQDIGSGRSDAFDAIDRLTKSRASDLGGVDRWAKLSVDMATMFKGDVVSSADSLAQSLDDISVFADKVSSTYKGSLSPATLKQIREFDMLGERGKAADLVFTALSDRFSGELKSSMSSTERASHAMGDAWDNLLKLGDPLIKQAETLAKVWQFKPEGVSGSKEFFKSLADEAARRGNRSAETQFRRVAGDMGKPSGDASDLSAQIARIGRELNPLDEQTQKVSGDINTLVKGFLAGKIGASDYADQLMKLGAQLGNLLSPLERAQQALSDERSVSALPAPQRASARARLSATRAAADRPTAAQEGQVAFDVAETQRLAALNDAAAALNRQTRAERELAAASFEGARAMSIVRAEAAKRDAEAQGQNGTLAYSASLAKDQAAAMQTLGGESSKLGSQLVFLNDVRTKGYDVALAEQRLRDAGLAGTKMEADARKALYEIIRAGNTVKEDQHRIDMKALDDQKALLAATNDNISASERAYRLAEIEANKNQDPSERDRMIDKAKTAREIANAERGKDIRSQMDPDIERQKRLRDLTEATGITEEQRAVKRREIERQYQDDLITRLQLEEDWASGADRAMRGYIKSVGTVADQTERLMTNAFKTMEDAMVDFAMTGELSFEKMAESIIRDLIRMQIQMSITIPIAKAMQEAGGIGGIFSNLFNFGGGGTSSPPVGDFNTGGATVTAARGAVFDNIIPFAKGGVVNGITPFRFGQGGAMSGIMGEAGPEAIVPLTRTPQGDLGIRSTGGGTQVTVEINNYGTQKEFDVEQQMGAFGPIVRIIARDEANKAVQGYAKGGGLTNQLRSDYNIRQPAVNRG
jgi:lambda family phage tail tape measure protein